MATYSELHNLLVQESEVRNKVKVALIVAAKVVYDENPETLNHTERLIWAGGVLSNTEVEVGKAFPILLASFKDQTEAQIKDASDSDVQTAVDNHINFLAGV